MPKPVGPQPETPVLRPLAAPYRAVERILGLLLPVPEAWLDGARKASQNSEGAGLSCTPCSRYRDLVNAWRKALRWTDGLDHALATMLASVASTKAVGDQLWIKVIGPAACGKSTLCEALAVNTDHVLAKSTIRGFHSGYRLDSEGKGGDDVSLIKQVRGKTLVTKDGDTLLQSPNLPQILSEARDLYDSVSRTHYRNAISRDYQGVRMTWILAGTSSLRSIDSSELGERFLDCVIMERIDLEMEREVLWRVVNRAKRNLAIEANGKPETQYDPALTEAMSLTGGYVDYLRENAQSMLSSVEVSVEAMERIMHMGLFVAYMRARPSKHQVENAEREFGSRLVSQHMRLAACLAFVLNRGEVDSEVLGRVRRIALDTARGRTLEIVRMLYGRGEEGAACKAVHVENGLGHSECLQLLKFLRKIGAVESYREEKGGERWRLTDVVRVLYQDVMA